MDTKLFVVQNPDGSSNSAGSNEDGGEGGGGLVVVEEGWSPSKLYRFHGFIQGLRMAYMQGVGDGTFYLGIDDDDGEGTVSSTTTTTTTTDEAAAAAAAAAEVVEQGRKLQEEDEDTQQQTVIGLVNIAAFLSQSMKETIKYDACDENNWDIIDGKYPLSNACGQLGQSYQDYNCPDEYIHMQCQVDPNMEITATTQASWYGAPGPLFCGPTSTYPTTGYWDYTYMCDYSWEDPPRYCTDYVGQKGGRYDNSEVVMNRNNRTDVMGCCWWGRGYVCCVYIFNIFIFSSLYVLILLLLLLLVMMLLLLLLLALSSSSSNSIAFLVAYLFLFWVCSYPPQISPPSLGHVFCRVIQTTGKKFPNAFLLSADNQFDSILSNT